MLTISVGLIATAHVLDAMTQADILHVMSWNAWFACQDSGMNRATAQSVPREMDAVSCVWDIVQIRGNIHYTCYFTAEEGGFCEEPGECRCLEGYSGINCDTLSGTFTVVLVHAY